MSSHEVVRKELEKSEEDVYVVYPAVSLRDEWVEKLRKRWQLTGLDKDYRAYMNAKDRYFSNIEELEQGGLQTYRITSMDYDLYTIICDLQAGILRDKEE
jgi:hypothetical protein